MKKLLAGCALATLLTMGSISAQAATPTSVAVINLAEIMSQIPQTKQSKQKLESEFASRQAEMKTVRSVYCIG